MRQRWMHGKTSVMIKITCHSEKWYEYIFTYICIFCNYCTIVIVVIIIIKYSSTGQSGKKQIVYELLSQPHNHMRHRKREKNNWGKQSTFDCSFPCQTQCIGKVIPPTSLGRQETPCKLGRSTLWYFELRWMRCGRSSSISNSLTSISYRYQQYRISIFFIHMNSALTN